MKFLRSFLRFFRRLKKDEQIPMLTHKGWILVSKKHGLTKGKLLSDYLKRK